jgi:biopolymer transport protein ExbD
MAMLRKKPRKEIDNPALEMTPMIDVVFQLLIFFIVTLKQEDILARLEVARPAPDPNAKKEEQPEDLLNIQVYNPRRLGGEGYVLKGSRVTLKELDRQLTRLAGFSKNISVVIKCTGNSRHAELVLLLDICSKLGLQNLSVFSL